MSDEDDPIECSNLSRMGVSGVSHLLSEDVQHLQSSGVTIDDDSEPVPENVPPSTVDESEDSGLE